MFLSRSEAFEPSTERASLRPRRGRRHTRRYAAIHHRRRRRHHHIMLDRPPTPVAPLYGDDEAAIAQAAPEQQELQGRLVVTVTHEPTLAVEVTRAPEDAPGYAAATCFRRDSDGAGIWERCTVRKDEQGADMVQTQVALAIPGPQPEILVVQAATPATDRTGEPAPDPKSEIKEQRVEEQQKEQKEQNP